MPEIPQPARPLEQMIVSAARLIRDNSVVMVGTQWPIIASLLAKSLHAPDVTICFEGGVLLGKIPDRIPLFTGDPVTNGCALLMGDCFDTLGMVLHAGRADMAILSGASVDRYGNINTTCIGDYASPKIRFGGSGGACDFGSLSSRTVIILEHDRQRFPERVDGGHQKPCHGSPVRGKFQWIGPQAQLVGFGKKQIDFAAPAVADPVDRGRLPFAEAGRNQDGNLEVPLGIGRYRAEFAAGYLHLHPGAARGLAG